MIFFEPNRSDDEGGNAFRRDAYERAPEQLPSTAQRPLDQIAEALGLTTALLTGRDIGAGAHISQAATLFEAATLLQTFIQIEDGHVRQRCINYVLKAAASEKK